MANNNVQNVRFLRNGSLYATRDAALTGLNGQPLAAEQDGSIILARYGSGNAVKTLVGLVYVNGDNKSLTIFDIEGASGDVEKLRQEINAKLGNGITSGNTATAQLTALSGTSDDASGVTSVWGAKKYAKEYTDAEIDKLDYSDTAVDGSYVSRVSEANGIIAVTRVALPTVDAISAAGKPITAVSESLGAISATAGTINAEYVDVSYSAITAQNVKGALAEIADEIDAMDKSADVIAGQVVTTVSETDGKVSETKANVKDLQLGGYTKDTTATGDIGSTDTINAALSKLENKAAAITIANADKSINVITGVSGTDINVNIKSGEKVLAKTGDAGIYTDLDLVKITTGLPETVKERYQLLATDDSQIGVDIDIPKDSHIVSINYITEGTHAQNLEYVYIDASGNTQTTYVDMSELVLEAEFESGVTATDGVVHGVVDPTSETFLTVGANGFKLSGVQNAIDSAIDALDVTEDAAVAGQYVAAIEQTDGVVAVKTRANVSEAVLNNYSKGSDSGAVASTDTINQAISKLENQIDSKVDALDATVSGETADGKVNVKVTETNGVITAVNVVGTDIASASALTAEIAARKAVDGQNGQTYAANSGKKYISGATSLNDADVALNDALDALDADVIKSVKVNGSGLAETNNEVNIQISSAKATGTDASPIIVNTDNAGAVTLQIQYLDCGVYDAQ